MKSTKGSLSAVWIVSSFLLMLPVSGCSVSGSGLDNQFDAADGPTHPPDAKPETTPDASPTLHETGPATVVDSAPDGVRDAAPNTIADAVPWYATEAGSEHGSSPDDATLGLDLSLEDSAAAADVPFAFEVQASPDLPLVEDWPDEPLPPSLDGPALLPVDGLAGDTAPSDSAPLDVAPVDLAQDPSALVDLPAPDLTPADVAPQPTSDWVIDNTTSIGGFTPTVMGAPTVTAMDAGTAVCFDGTHDGLRLATNPILGMQRFTIETLVFPEFPGTSDPRLIYIGDTVNSNPRVALQMRSDPSGTWHFYVSFYWAGKDTSIEDTTFPHPSNAWYWLALSYDGQTARLYVNGVLESSTNLTFGPMTTGSTSLGARQVGQYYFPGCMREVEFFTSALPASQLDNP